MNIKEDAYLRLVDLFFKQQDQFEDDTFSIESERYRELFRAVAEFLDEVEYAREYGNPSPPPKDLRAYADDDYVDESYVDGEPDLESQELEDFAQDGYFENMEPNDDGFTWS